MVNSSPLIEGKYDYSKKRKGVYVILYTIPKFYFLSFSMNQQTRKDMLQLAIKPMTRTGLHEQRFNHSAIEAQSSHSVFIR